MVIRGEEKKRFCNDDVKGRWVFYGMQIELIFPQHAFIDLMD